MFRDGSGNGNRKTLSLKLKSICNRSHQPIGGIGRVCHRYSQLNPVFAIFSERERLDVLKPGDIRLDSRKARSEADLAAGRI